MKTHKLMIKEHVITGLKYLCYTKSEGEKYDSYKGSGKFWQQHLKKHGNNITTKLIFESDDFEEFKKEAIKKSYEYNIVESKEWANLKIEEGDGGDTVSNKMWITDGVKDKYIFKDSVIPNGWQKGRSTGAFTDSQRQKEFSKRVDYEKRAESLKEAWSNGKFDKRDNTKLGGALHTECTKKMLSEKARFRNKLLCPHCDKYFQPGMAKRWHFDNCKMKNND